MASLDSGVDTENDSNDSNFVQVALLKPTFRENTVSTESPPPARNYKLFDQDRILFDHDFASEKSYQVTEEFRGMVNNFSMDQLKYERPSQFLCLFKPYYEHHYRPEVHRNKICQHERMHASHFSPFHSSHEMARVNAEKKLRVAANFNNVCVVKQLLENGVNPQSVDKKKRTALHISACKGYEEIVKLLLAHGANPHQKDIVGNTALHVAAYTNHFRVIRLLLDATASNLNSLDDATRHMFRSIHPRLKSVIDSYNTDNPDNDFWEKIQAIRVLQEIFIYCKEKTESELIDMFANNLSLKHGMDDEESTIQDALNSLSELTLQKRV